MTLRIVTYGDPILRRPTRNVAEITGELQRLIDEMVVTMYRAPGIGLAANQIGSPLRLFVANPAEDHDPAQLIVFVNPEIVAVEGGYGRMNEGCLSIPDVREDVQRARVVVLRGLDRHGQPQEIEGHELLARIFQHEMDHLNGLVFVDRLSPAKRDLILGKLRKVRSGGQGSGVGGR
jgi:peptide deformylase